MAKNIEKVQDSIKKYMDESKQDAPKDDQKKSQKKYDYKSIGIALENDQIKRLDEIAKEIGYNRSELVRFAVDDLIRRFESGEIRTATETKTVTVLKSD